jgi:hypothetical protein
MNMPVTKLFEGLRRHVGVHDEQIRHLGEQRDGHEILVHVVRLVRKDVGVHRQRADVAHDDGVSIGCGLGHVLHRRNAGAAALVVDEHGLPQLLGQFVGHRARDDLRRATRRERHDEADRLARPCGLRTCECRQCHAGSDRQRLASVGRHDGLLQSQNW